VSFFLTGVTAELREVTATSMTGFSLRRRIKLQGVLVIAEIAVATISASAAAADPRPSSICRG